MVHFERNMKILAEFQKPVYDKMQKPQSDNVFPDTQVGFGQNNEGVMDNVVMNVNGALYVAGTVGEAETWVKGVDTNAHTFVVFGLGLGYHVEMLIDKFPTATIYVIEPDKRVFGHAMYLKDFEKIITRCKIWLDDSVLDIKMKVFEMLTHPLARGIAVVPFYSAVYQSYSSVMYAELQKMMNDWAVMLNTKRSLADKWYKNRFENAKVDAVNLSALIGKFKGIPGILVGAAPSLQTQIEKLKSLQGKAVIIAASTAAEILKTHGIKPTFMIAIDQDPITSGGLHENMDGDIPLIYDGQVAQNSLHYKGKKFQMLLNVNRYTGMIVPTLPVIESGPSVANVTLDLLYKFGCNPILITGMDMSYTNNKLYCDGTQFQKDIECNEHLMKLPGFDGKDCYTEPSFLAMRNWYEEYIPRVKPPVFNCTAAGLPIAGTEHKTLDDFDFSVEYNLDKMIDDAYYKPNSTEPNYIDLSKLPVIRQELIAELDKIKEAVTRTNGITPDLATMRAWFILDEFVSSMVYLHEIREEYRIVTGKLTPEEAIKQFQQNRTRTILEQIEVVKAMLQ